MVENPRNSRITTDELRRRIAAWNEEPTDELAAARVGMDYAAYSQWRRTLGLPLKAKAKTPIEIPARDADWLASRLEHIAASARETAERLRTLGGTA